MKHIKWYLGILVGTLATGLFVNQAEAVPSFARQTGMACAACHTVFPELNSFGRTFKLNGYTLTGITQVEAKTSKDASGLQFNQIPPLSAMLQVAGTYTQSQTPTQQFSLPDQLSFFFAGEISPNLGSFIQITMDNTGEKFAMDNTDIRYANHAGNTTYGVTVNNSPTVQDLWNSTPAWGFPWTHGNDVNNPVIAGSFAQKVMGLGGYADWGNGIYTELSLYRETVALDAPSGVQNGTSTQQVRLASPAPYWRLAWNKTFSGGDYLMLGTYGLQSVVVDGTSYAGATDKYNDAALDMQYEHPLTNGNMLSVHASYTTEQQALDLSNSLDSAKPLSATMGSTRVDGTYHWGYHVAATLGYAGNTSDTSSYQDTAYTAQVSYLPWQNTKFTAQYVAYTQKGGDTSSSVSDNNTFLLQGWLMW